MTGPAWAPHLVTDQHAEMLDETATATFSPDRVYRYRLTRHWDDTRPPACFIMLNPSTADAFTVDPTVRRCLAFARAWGAGGLLVLNLFALRSTDPAVLRTHPDPVGPDNDTVLRHALTGVHGPVVAAWGVHGTHGGRAQHVTGLLEACGVNVLCLGATKAGHPRHPLYVPGTAPLVPYPTALEAPQCTT
jgi:hypothetical protein